MPAGCVTHIPHPSPSSPTCARQSLPLREERLQAEQQQQRAEDQHRQRDRALQENHVVAGAHRERLAQRELEHRREHEPERDRREIVTELAQHVADPAHDEHDPDVDDAVADRIAAEDAEAQYARIQIRIRNAQQIHEEADQRQVEDQQHGVADVHARDETPEKLGLLRNQHRTR